MLCMNMVITVFAKRIVSQDYEVLADFYNNTHGSNWIKRDGWLSADSTPWHGITLNERGRVVEINLESNNLSGSLPATIGNLSELQVLNLYDNQLMDSLPSSLGNLSRLKVLRLTKNNLTGKIPASLGNLSKLQRLLLTDNNLAGSIPLSLSNLYNLGELTLNNNQLSDTIPSWVGSLSKLYKLLLSYNHFSGNIPTSLSNLSYLWILNLSNNELTGNIPSSLGSLFKLQKLYLANNRLTGSIPSSFANFFTTSPLLILDISHNHLSGKIPVSLDSLLAKVKMKLLLDHNWFTFDGLEELTQKRFDTLSYTPQAKIPVYEKSNLNEEVYSVFVGGTPSNNIYKWYKNGVYFTTITGDSTLHVKYNDIELGADKFSVVATNTMIKELALYGGDH